MAGKKKKNRHQQEPGAQNGGESTESCEENQVTSTVSCPHAAKAVDLQKVKKALKFSNGISRECTECAKSKEPTVPGEDNSSPALLWMCLKCGNQACGRSGKQHALKHQATPHSESHDLALSTDMWNVWCYSCDKEISPSCKKKLLECVEFLKKQEMATFVTSKRRNGLAVSEAEVQEKEDQGDLKNVMSTNRSASSRSRNKTSPTNNLPRLRGLCNLGNTCFFNAVLQCLARTPFLLPVLQELNKPGQKFTLPGTDELPPLEGTLAKWGSLTEILASTLEELSSNKPEVLNPHKLLAKVTQRCPQFAGGDQHDSHELLRHLLEGVRTEDLKRYQTIILHTLGLSEKCNPSQVEKDLCNKVKVYGRQAAEQLLVPEQVFRGYLVSTVECQDCLHTSNRVESFLDLSLPVIADKPQPPVMRRKGSTKECAGEVFEGATTGGQQPSKYQVKKDRKQARKGRKKQQKGFSPLEDTTAGTVISEEGGARPTDESEQSDADIEDNLDQDSKPSQEVSESGYSSEKLGNEDSTLESPVPNEDSLLSSPVCLGTMPSSQVGIELYLEPLPPIHQEPPSTPRPILLEQGSTSFPRPVLLEQGSTSFPRPLLIEQELPSSPRSLSPEQGFPPTSPRSLSPEQRSPSSPQPLSPDQRSPSSPLPLSPEQRSPSSPQHLSLEQGSPFPPQHLSPEQGSPFPPQHLSLEQGSPSSPQHLSLEQRSPFSPQPLSLEQRSPSSPQPLSPEQRSPSSPQPLSPEQRSPSSPQPLSPEQRSPSSPQPLSPEQRSPSSPQPLSPEQRSPSSPQPLSPEQRSLSSPQPLSPEQRSPSSPQPLSPEQRSPSSPQPLSPEQRSPSSPQPLSPEQRSPSSPQPLSPEQRSPSSPQPLSPEQRSSPFPPPLSPNQGSLSFPKPLSPVQRSPYPPQPLSAEQISLSCPKPLSAEQVSLSCPKPLSAEQVSLSCPKPLSAEQVSPSSLRPFSTGGPDDMPTCNPLGVFHSSSPGSSELNVDCASPGSLLGHGSASPLSAGDSDRPISRMAFCSERGPRHTSPEHFAQDFSQLCISAENCNNTITALVPFEAPPPKRNLGVSGMPVIALEWYTSSTDYPETFLKGSEADSFEEAAIGTDAIPSPGGDCGWGSTLAHRYQLEGDQCTVQSCLNQFTALELMTGSNKVGCENCSQRHNHGKEGKMVYTNSTKQLLVSWPPGVLILHLKRFQVFRSMFRKISCQVNFPLVLDIAPICSSKAAKDCPTIRPGQTQVLYSLYGVVEHSGGLHGGHYVAYVKVRAPITPDDPRWSFLPPNLNGRNSTVQLGQDDALPEPPAGRWFHVSDSRVNEVSEERVLKSPAYLLFYERIY